ncbi:hypothetical protein Tco_0180809 [Tanacetum coccineum]
MCSSRLQWQCECTGVTGQQPHRKIFAAESKPDEEANNNPDERLNDNIMKSLFGCDPGATRKKEDGRKPATVAKESPVALISQSFTDADVRGSPNTNKKHNVSVAITKPSPRVRSLAPPNSVPQDGILDAVVNENRQWHGSSCHGSGQRINLAAEGADTARRNSSIHGIHIKISKSIYIIMELPSVLLFFFFFFLMAINNVASAACSNGTCKLLDKCESDGDCEAGLYCFSCPQGYSGSKCVRFTATPIFNLMYARPHCQRIMGSIGTQIQQRGFWYKEVCGRLVFGLQLVDSKNRDKSGSRLWSLLPAVIWGNVLSGKFQVVLLLEIVTSKPGQPLAQKDTYAPDSAKANMVEHAGSSSRSNSKGKGKDKKRMTRRAKGSHRAANCKMPKRVNRRQANMVDKNVDMIAMVSDVCAMIS